MTSPALMPRTSAAGLHRPTARAKAGTPVLSFTLARQELPPAGPPQQQHEIYIGTAATGGHRSPMIAGPETEVVQALVRWADTQLAPQSRVDARFYAVAPGQEASLSFGVVVNAFHRSELVLASVSGFRYLDLATHPATMAVAQQRLRPDVLTLRQWQVVKKPYKAGTYWPVADPDATGADEGGQGAILRLMGTQTRWCSADRPLMLHSPARNLSQYIEPAAGSLEVYTDASLAHRDTKAGFGLVCPATGMIGSGVLAATWTLSFDSAISELMAISAAVDLLRDTGRHLVIYTDSQAAIRWWQDPASMPEHRGQVQRLILDQRKELDAAGLSCEVRWVRGHAGHEANEWADRAARLSWRCVDWCEDETVRQRKFRNLAAEFGEELAAQAGGCVAGGTGLLSA